MSTLHIITGAPGAGKTTLLRHLRAYPLCAVDFDELPDRDGTVLGVEITSAAASSVWPTYNRLWVRIATMLLRAGGPVLVLCPLTPDEWRDAAAGTPAPQGSWARLDCGDGDRRARLDARGWRPEEVRGAVEDAAELRRMVDREFTTTGRGADEVAADIADWVAGGTGPRGR